MTKTKLFYIYIYYDPRPGKDEVPIYVGKGCGGRFYTHWRYNSKNPMLRGLVLQCKELGLKPVIEVLGDMEDETEAFAYEAALIATFGRRDLGTGTLYNMTDGGEGVSGATWKNSPETVAKRTKAITGLKRTAETREKISAVQRGRKEKPEAVEKRRQAVLGQTRTEEQRQRMCEAQSKLFPEERRQQISNARKGIKFSDSHRASLKDAWNHKPRQQTEETKAKIGASHLGQKRSEETRRKLSIKATEREARKRERRLA